MDDISNQKTSKTLRKRDDIIRHAFQCFFRHGFKTTSVDQALVGTGISKRTLYKYFATKEDVIVATLEHYHTLMMNQLTQSFAQPYSYHERICNFFDVQAGLLKATNFCGCYAIRAQSEYARTHAGIESACNKYFDDIIFILIKNCDDPSRAEETAHYRRQHALRV